MTEIQEQKSKSSDTPEAQTEQPPTEIKAQVTNNISVQPLAQQYQAFVPFTYTELREAFDDYWVKNMEVLMKQLPQPKLMKKKGGMFDPADAQRVMERTYKAGKLYRSALFDIFVKKMEEYKGKGSVLFINSLELVNFQEGEECPVVAVFYFRPEIEFEGEIDFKCKRPEHKTWEDYWKLYTERVQKQHKILTPDEGQDIHENHNVLLDIIASSDDKPAKDLSCRLKWVEVQYLKPDSLKADVLSHKRGDMFETTFTLDMPEGAKEVKASVKIHELQTVDLPAVDDELAKTMKFETADIWKASEKVKFEEYQKNADKSTVVDHVITDILHKSKVPPAPISWLDANARRIMADHVAVQGKGNAETAAKMLGCAGEEEMLDAFRSQVNRDYIQDLVMRKYAQVMGIDFDMSKVFDHMLSKAEWEEAKK